MKAKLNMSRISQTKTDLKKMKRENGFTIKLSSCNEMEMLIKVDFLVQ